MSADALYLPEGEFHVDLYTLPDNLIKMLWDFTNERVPAGA
jgi:transcription initiation factor TFIID/TFIIF subunit